MSLTVAGKAAQFRLKFILALRDQSDRVPLKEEVKETL